MAVFGHDPDLLVSALNEHAGHANGHLINDGVGHFVVSQDLLPAAVTRRATIPAILGRRWQT